MHGQRKTRQKGGKVYEWRQYVCSTYMTRGKTLAAVTPSTRRPCWRCCCGSCGRRSWPAAIVRSYASESRRRLAARQTTDPAEVEALREKVAHLTAEIEQGTKRLMRVPEELFTALSGELAATTRERDRLAGDLDGLESGCGGRGKGSRRGGGPAVDAWGNSYRRPSPNSYGRS